MLLLSKKLSKNLINLLRYYTISYTPFTTDFCITMASTNPVPSGTTLSIAIPWIEMRDGREGPKIDKEFVKRTFDALGLGEILDVQLIERAAVTTPKFKRAHQKGFVHYGDLTATGQKSKNHLDQPATDDRQPEFKVWYSEQYYWKARKSKFEFRQDEPAQSTDSAAFKPRVEF